MKEELETLEERGGTDNYGGEPGRAESGLNWLSSEKAVVLLNLLLLADVTPSELGH